MASIVCNDTLIQGGGDEEGGLETPTKNALSKPRGLFTQMPEQCASAAARFSSTLCVIFTILVSFSRDNALFASKAEINIF